MKDAGRLQPIGHTMLHRLVESLVLRELDSESPAVSSSSRTEAAEGQFLPPESYPGEAPRGPLRHTMSRHTHVSRAPLGQGMVAQADKRVRPPPDGFGDTAALGNARPIHLPSLQVSSCLLACGAVVEVRGERRVAAAVAT